jgi:hypothetical protein
MSNIKDLENLLPDNEITVNGEVITIRPFPFAKLPKVIALLSRLGVGIFELFKNIDSGGNLIISDTLFEKVGTIVEEHFADVGELMGIYCNKPIEYFTNEESGLNGEDGIFLLLAIIERNYSFFTKRLAPILNQLQDKTLQTKADLAGKK